MWNLKYDTNEFTQETETDLWLPMGRGMGDGSIRSLDLADANFTYRMDKQGPTVQRREFQYSVINHNEKQYEKEYM